VRIAYVSNSVLPSRAANTVQVLKMCDALASRGHDLRLFLRTKGQPVEWRGVLQAYKLTGGFEVDWVKDRALRGWRHVYGFLAARRAHTWGADLVYSRLIPACFAAAALGRPVIFEGHKPPLGRTDLWMLKRLIHSGRLLRVVVISEALRREYLRVYPSLQSRILVAPDGADSPPKRMRPLAPPDQPQSVGYAGHLYPGKGMELILAIASMAPWARFHVIGGTEADIERWRPAAGELYNVIFEGYLPHSDVIERLTSFDVLIAPYLRRVADEGRTDIGQWMSPLKLFEYMAAGRPILCSNLPVLAEVVRHQEEALLCDPDDADAWVAGLRRLRDDPSLGETIGRKAHAALLQKYTWSRRADCVLEGLDGPAVVSR
jgi:glycosyltransferase involved in cell wall biosynthesis